MREYIESLRAIWDTFQTGARLRYRGEHYQFRLMAPFFNPGPIENPEIPVYLSGGGSGIWRLAGEICAGLHVAALHSPSYLREVISPAFLAGLNAARRERKDFTVAAPASVISMASDREWRRAKIAVSERLANLASKPENRPAMDWHGLGSLADDLVGLASANRPAEMPESITEELLRRFALIAAPDEVYEKLLERYEGVADRVCLELMADCPALYGAIAKRRHQSA